MTRVKVAWKNSASSACLGPMSRRVSRPMAGSSMRIQNAMTSAKPKAIRPLASVVEKATMPLALPWAMEEAQDAADFCTSLMTFFTVSSSSIGA